MDERSQFLADAAAQRRDRELQRVHNDVAIKLQALARGYLARQKFVNDIRSTLSDKLSQFTDLEKSGKTLLSNDEVLKWSRLFLRIKRLPEDNEILAQLCRHIILSLDSSAKDTNWATMFLNKTTIAPASKVITDIISCIPQSLMYISGARVSEVKTWQTYIHFLIVFGFPVRRIFEHFSVNEMVQKVLNDLCGKLCCSLGEHANFTRLANSLFLASNEHKPVVSSQALNALFSIIMKYVKVDNSLLPLFITHVLTCPAIVLHLNKANLDTFLGSGLFDRCLTHLRASSDIVEGIEPQKTINLLGNVVHLGYLDEETVKGRIVDWTWVIGLAMAQCTEFAVRAGEQSSHNHWHPIFGHYKLPIDPKTERSLRNVLKQLQMLWSYRIVCRLFDKALEGVDQARPNGHVPVKELGATFNKLWKKLGGGPTSDSLHVGENEKEIPPTLAAVVCQLYMTALSTMANMKNEIIAGVCREDRILRQLWAYLVRWGAEGKHTSSPSLSTSPLNAALALLARPQSPHVAPLRLFADAAAIVISILDEEELYERAVPFPLEELVHIARFCNYFCFRAVWNGYVDDRLADQGLFASIHQLCMVLHVRDSRRTFVNDPKFWLAPDVKSSVMMGEFEKKTSRGLLLMRRMSHLISLKERMLLFRKFVTADKGLDEAGIDQDGVFKEFLELTIKQVFDPALNLFHSTAAGVLYPSPTSSVHEDHLALFQFVGRILAKAVYEGIVVDVQLAPVLLAAMLGGRRLCAFDELSQLDPELYRNLTFVKKYDGDVSDLSLTFSIDEDFMGKISTVDLVPGGRTIQVTNENKIDYVHRMAHHRVFSQTKQQCRAFVAGAQSVLNPAWLFLFAPHELQFIISGYTSDIDLADLKKHVQYYGGFHGSHRLIKWLWEIVEKDFTPDERRLFLKFVTSCSRPPLLGFSYLEPPFSIRCVEVSDDQDQGDTLGSVVRGFLALKKSQSSSRLPTASTCFNLLKLPNYNKKSVLLSKLRYAIHSETGFELS
ncbi:HECT-domain protein [Ancylostoma caninum]|uniref:Ubiquitin-protein ligase E3B n=1 Tax=Ancylostoma caninum TaxID=29170 RepID=A0A368G2D8_ANCCA|nr:HECT-domain protein [Ancylostoma caninum]